ncbi:MAG: Ada metal-binding domain-containing protein [Candidatus Hodarchaeota archaeon]
MKELTYETMLEARLARDPFYDGKFYVGISSTGIYCLPSCKARQASEKNIVFFLNRDDAEKAGFKGCKRCKAEFFPNVAPKWLKEIVSYMKENLNNRIDESTLIELSKTDITTIRRYFKTHFNTSPMAYHRKLRLEHAKKLIDQGANYLSAAFESGFKSISGFREAFIKEYGITPAEGRSEL